VGGSVLDRRITIPVRVASSFSWLLGSRPISHMHILDMREGNVGLFRAHHHMPGIEACRPTWIYGGKHLVVRALWQVVLLGWLSIKRGLGCWCAWGSLGRVRTCRTL
jgi:hypothetical protein